MTEEYKRYMRSREWDAKRQQRLDVDEYCCAMCGRPEAKCRNWQYYFAHFLLPYDIDKFTEFDITGRTEKKVTDQELTKIKQYLSKVRQDCIEHPEKYYKGNVTVSCNGLSKREDNK